MENNQILDEQQLDEIRAVFNKGPAVNHFASCINAMIALRRSLDEKFKPGTICDLMDQAMAKGDIYVPENETEQTERNALYPAAVAMAIASFGYASPVDRLSRIMMAHALRQSNFGTIMLHSEVAIVLDDNNALGDGFESFVSFALETVDDYFTRILESAIYYELLNFDKKFNYSHWGDMALLARIMTIRRNEQSLAQYYRYLAIQTSKESLAG